MSAYLVVREVRLLFNSRRTVQAQKGSGVITFYQYAREYPPVIVRLLARRKNGPPLTTHEIAARSIPSGKITYKDLLNDGSFLSPYEVNAISECLQWDTIPFGKMVSFLRACGMDFTDPKEMNRKKVYLKLEHKFLYLRKSPEFETILRPLIVKWREHVASKIK